MDFLNKRECHFCGIIIRDENFEEINHIIKEKLGIILMKFTLDKEVQYVTCKVCSAKLFAASDFKTSCLHKNDTIIPYVDFESSRQKEWKQGNSILKNQEICRLCLQPTDGKHKSMKDVPSKTVEMYIPEINFAKTTDPAICLKCIDALCIHTTFIQSYLDVEKNRNMNDIDVEDIQLTNDGIKTEEIEIKSEETGEDESHFKINYLNITKVDNAEGDPSGYSTKGLMDMEEGKIQYGLNNLDQRTISAQSVDTNCKSTTKKIFRCDECGYNSHNKVYMKNHLLTHKDPSEVQMYKCQRCKFETKYRKSLRQHQLSHKDPFQVRMHKCDQCKFETKYRNNLRHHQLTHQDASQVQMFKCDKCNFETKRRTSLRHHQLTHRDPSEVQMYKCDDCSYKSLNKSNLKRHQLTHSQCQLYRCDYKSLFDHQLKLKDSSQGTVYKCDKCQFETKLKGSFKNHKLTHKEHSEVRTYECALCQRQVADRSYLVKHLQICRVKNDPQYQRLMAKHEDTSQGKTYKCKYDKCKYETIHKQYLNYHKLVTHSSASFKCEHCPFETKYRSRIETHLLRHAHPWELELFQCGKCDFKTKQKRYLTCHEQRHKDPSEVKMYECSVCDYKTIERSNLSRHLWRHKDASEVQLFSCDQYSYKCKNLLTLQAHRSKHRKPPLRESEVKIETVVA